MKRRPEILLSLPPARAWLMTACLLASGGALAKGGTFGDETRWSFSLLLGAQSSKTDDLNKGLYQSPFMGEAIILVREGGAGAGVDGEDVDQNETAEEPFRFDNPLPDEQAAALAGFEFSWHPNDRHAFFFGINSWERTAINEVTGNLPLQQFFINNVVEGRRKGTLSFTEYQLGWRYSFVRRPKFRFFSSLSIHEVFDIDYQERWVFLFADSPIEDLIGVRRDIFMEAQTAALFMGGIGLGGEWFVRDWLSLGFEGKYLISESEFTLRDVRERNDFISGDQVTRSGMPFRRMSDGRLGYLVKDATAEDLEDPDTREAFYQPIKLNLDGWRLLFRVNLYY
ncbi:MAG TPA: hypothetical protein ENK29_04840 [Chromatiales bacterium]|nr:hypothetical protein [Chromatiales bacterium]